MHIDEAEEASPSQLLPSLREQLALGTDAGKVHDLRVTLGKWLCRHRIMSGACPDTAVIHAALQKEGLAGELRPADVISGWYWLQEDAYRIVERLPVDCQPGEALIRLTIAAIIGQFEAFIEDANTDPELRDDVPEFTAEIARMKLLEPSAVQGVWNVCQSHCIPPFPRVELQQMN